MTSEVEKLDRWCADNGARIVNVTTSYELGLSDSQPSAEEIAAELNRVNKWLEDPVNKLISSIEGHMFLKSDYIMCTENRAQVVDYEPFFLKTEISKEEAHKISNYKRDVELFKAAIDMIKDLASKRIDDGK